jgi:hypothetical protein
MQAFAQVERRAARGKVTLAQLHHEIHALRQRFTAGLSVVLCSASRRHRSRTMAVS